MTVNDIREMFPQLSEKVYNKPLVYLDNAATSLRPKSVLDKWNEISVSKNANIHRAVHHMAELATSEYETARDAVAEFLNASCREEIIFTSGATMSLNLVAQCFTKAFVGEGDEILIAESEHHSNIVPWQLAAQEKKAVIKVLPVDDSGYLRIDLLPGLITSKTKILCFAHVSNVLGIINPVKEIVKLCHSKNCKVLVDGSQGVVHCSVDVQDLDCDFYAFSGHKMYAAPGTGVLYGKKELLDAMPPFLGGGEMIQTVRFSGTTYAPLPEKYEAGTQNISGAPTLKPAIELLKQLKDNQIEQQYNQVKEYVLNMLSSDSRIKLFGVPRRTSDKIAVFSFCVEGAHHEDVALILDKMGVAVRSGQMCAEPLMDRMGVTGMLRASFAPYNTMQEAEYFISSLNKAIQMLS